MINKEKLDFLVEKYETESFIEDDPVQFMRKYKNEEDMTLAGFIASCFSYGNRKVFIKKLNELFDQMGNSPYNFILDCNCQNIDFSYRFAKTCDVQELFKKLHNLYKSKKSLKDLFQNNYHGEIMPMFQCVCDYFYDGANLTQGYCHLIPNPKNKGTMKRLNMFLRWLIRKPPVDFGLWDFIKPSELLIPFDVHVARISRQMGLLNRSSNDYKAVLELTNQLKIFDCNDPIKYDFALFGYGIENNK
ncbi:TIGR02757 family protein [bacterium]|nr:TIGR02757 family protein [bacterium]